MDTRDRKGELERENTVLSLFFISETAPHAKLRFFYPYKLNCEQLFYVLNGVVRLFFVRACLIVR